MVKNRFIYFDVMKIICIFLVIINHSHLYLTENGIFFHFLHFSIFSISKVAVPIFMMISGALMLGKNDSYDVILKKRIPRVYLACLFSTLIGVFFYKIDFFDTFFKFILGGQISSLYFLWYIYVLVILYLLTPLLNRMIIHFNKDDFNCFFILFLIVPSIIQFLMFVFEFDFNLIDVVGRIYNQYSFLINIGYYVLGYFLFSNKDNLNIKKLIYSFLFGFVLSMIYLCLGFFNKGTIVNLKYDSFPVVLMSASLFVFLINYFNDVNNKYLKKIIIIFSECSFGVYLTHVYLLEFLIKTNLFINVFKFNLFIGYFFLINSVFLFLSFIFYLIRKIPILKKIF